MVSLVDAPFSSGWKERSIFYAKTTSSSDGRERFAEASG